MNNKWISWLKPFLTFGIALATLGGCILIFVHKGAALEIIGALLLPLAFPLFFWLVMEAAAQADPSQLESPLAKFKKKYPNSRDRTVVLSGYVILYIAYSCTLVFEHDNKWIFALTWIAAVVMTYGIYVMFGSQELKAKVIPKWVKRVMLRKKP
jgi:hypothetical protein